MLLHDVRQCNADLVHTPPGSGGCGEHGEQSVTGLDVAAAAPVWRPLAASVASVALPMKFSSVSRLLLHWPAHWHHRDQGTLLYWCWGHWPLVSTQAGASTWSCSNIARVWLGEARQCPLYPVSRSASRCGGGRCGVLRSIHYTVIGMQGGAGPAPAQLATLLPPSQQPQTHLSLSTCCVHCHWSPAQQLRAVRRGDLFSYLLLLKPFFNIHDTWWTLGSKWYRQSDDLLQEVIKITFGPACHINYQYETGAEYVVCRAAWCWGWILDHKNCATDTALTHTASHSSACSL